MTNDQGPMTMQRIQQLPASVVTKIAAGEVIERPASVIKELLENSVDAGSTRIDVEIEQGGGELIRVVDDGSGIHPDDLPLAFASHATSKLSSADDLFRIGTLGFRGEALASIAGVAQVTLQSRPPDQVHGAEITCHSGELWPVRLHGYLADPAIERGNAKMQYLFLNGRWIRDRSLGHAIQEAYRGLLMTGRYAVVFLFLELPPDQVDVNVHPTKAEVRFRDSQALYHLVRACVKRALMAKNLVPRLQAPEAPREWPAAPRYEYPPPGMFPPPWAPEPE